MKYIRTKDDRIVAIPNNSKFVLYDDEKLVINTTQRGQTCVYGIVKKKADTIEELCDVIVCRNELFYPLTSNREGNEFDWEEINRFRKSVCMSEEAYNIVKETTDGFESYLWNVYGAIWTDKGLIYIAKMNDKGELELL